MATSGVWKIDSDPKPMENFIDRSERNADKRNRNTNERLLETIVTVQQFPKNSWKILKSLIKKCLQKIKRVTEGDDDSSDARGKTLHNAIRSVCIIDNQTENAAALGPEGPGHILRASDESSAVASPEPSRKIPSPGADIGELCRMDDYSGIASGERERDVDPHRDDEIETRSRRTWSKKFASRIDSPMKKIKKFMENGLRTLGDQIHRERVYFEVDRAERLSATKRLREELDALAEEQIKGRRTLEAGLQSVEARILEAIAGSKDVPSDPACTPPRVGRSQDGFGPR